MFNAVAAWTTAKPDVYAIVLGAPGAEISPAVNFATLKFKFARTLTDAYIKFNTAPVGADFLLDINVNGSIIAQLAVLENTTTSTALGATYTIAADATITIDISQTGISPDTGKDGSLMLVFAS